MKKIVYILLLAAVALGPGCNETDFLEEQPRDDIYPENLLVDRTGFESMLTALYGLMRHEYRRVDYIGGGFVPMTPQAAFAAGADDAWGNNAESPTMAYTFYPARIRETDLSTFKSLFDWLYQIIGTANMVITRADGAGIDWEGTSDEENLRNKEQIVACARFFRAWAYRHLTYAFGAVPLSTTEITGLNYRNDWERNSVADIRRVMKEDFQYAADHLDLRTKNNNRISGAVAIHYLGELYLAMNEPEEAAKVLKPLVEGTEYALMTAPFGSTAATDNCAFIDLFRTPQYRDGNREVLMYFDNTEPTTAAAGTAEVFIKCNWKNYYANVGSVKNGCCKDAPEVTAGTLTQPKMIWMVNGGKGAGRCSVSLGALRLYNYKKQGALDERISDKAMVWMIKTRNADGRDVDFLVNGKTIIDTTLTSGMLDNNVVKIKNYSWPSTRKWDYTQQVAANGDSDWTYADVVYLRLADTYLLYAEALYKTDKAGEAIKWINFVRTRSKACEIAEGDLTGAGLDLILDERSRELLCEEERRHTLMRISQTDGGDERALDNYFKRRSRALNEIAGRATRGMDVYDTPVMFPIPQSFLDANTGRKLEQNPGY